MLFGVSICIRLQPWLAPRIVYLTGILLLLLGEGSGPRWSGLVFSSCLTSSVRGAVDGRRFLVLRTTFGL